MRKTGKNIAKQVHEKHPEFSLEFLEDLDYFIFSTLNAKIRKAESLIYKIAPIGNFTFRKRETEEYLKRPYMVDPSKTKIDVSVLKQKLEGILDNYADYTKDKLKLKYEKFGKESHEAYLLAKKQKRIQKYQKNKLK